MFDRLRTLARTLWQTHCAWTRRYPLYRAGIMLTAQVLLTGHLQLRRLATVMLASLLDYLSRPWSGHDPEDLYAY